MPENEQQLEEKLVTFTNMIADLAQEKSDYATRLQRLGLKRDDFKNYREHIALIDSQTLQLQKLIEEYTVNLVELRNVRYIAEYTADSATLLFEINELLTIDTDRLMNAQQATRIFNCADRALAVSTQIQDPAVLIQCWQMVHIGRTIAFNAFKQDPKNPEHIANKAKYLVGGRKIFAKLIQQLPAEMQLLKIFYAQGDYEHIADYLREFVELDIDNAEEYRDFVARMTADVNVAANNRARISLEKIANFASLPENVRDELIQQRAYINRLRSILSFTDVPEDDPVRKRLYALSEQLDATIKNVILNDRNLNRSRDDVQRIQSEISAQDSEMSKRIFQSRIVEHTADFKKSGVGVAAWLFGGAVLPSALVTMAGLGAVAMAAKAIGATAVEAKVAMHGSELEATKKLAAELRPVDFDYITDVDAVFNANTAIPVEQMHVTGTTSDEYLKDKAAEAVATRIAEPLRATVTPVVGNLVKLVTALFAITIASLVLNLIIFSILFPLIWPLWIGLALVAGIGLIAWQVMQPQTRMAEKIMSVASSITFNLASTFNLLLAPMRSMTANFQQGRYLRGTAALASGVVLGVFGIALAAVVTPLAVVSGLFAVAAGKYLGYSLSEITDRVFRNPVRVIQDLNTASNSTQQKMQLTPAEIATLDELEPGFSKELHAIFQDRVNELAQDLAKVGVGSNPEDIRNLNSAIQQLENRWSMTQQIIHQVAELHAQAKHTHDPQQTVAAQQQIKHLCMYLDDYLQGLYRDERPRFIERAKALKQEQEKAGQAVPIVATVEHKTMRFSRDPKLKAAEQLIGAAPDFAAVKPNEDYSAERRKMELIADLGRKVHNIQARIR